MQKVANRHIIERLRNDGHHLDVNSLKMFILTSDGERTWSCHIDMKSTWTSSLFTVAISITLFKCTLEYYKL